MPTRYGSISLKKGIWKDSTYPNGVEITKIVEDGVTVWHKDYVGLTYTKLEDHSYSIRAEDTSISGDIKIHAVHYFKSGLATSIENRGFYNCNNITSVDIYDGIEYIGIEAFAGCDNLKYVIMPTSVTYIGEYAFWSSPADIYYRGSVDEWFNFINGLDDFTADQLKDRAYVYAGSNAAHLDPFYEADADTLPPPDGFKGYWYYDENGVPATATLCDYYTDDGLLNFSIVEIVEPTCTEAGYIILACNDCGKQFRKEADALGHEDTDIVYAPTCTEQGYTWHICSRCGRNYKDTPTDALGHKYSSIVKPPTCTEQGYTTHTCSGCNDSYVDSYVAALGHSYLPSVTPPTCTSKGYTTHTCMRCSDSYKDNFTLALGHSWKDATCTAPKTCSVCGATEGSALGHIEVIDAAILPTCTADGKTEGKHCSRCGAVIVAQSTVPRLGHLYGVTIKAPTCTEQGYDLYTCARCGDSYETNFTEALGHNWVDATCTTPKTCSRCDATEGEALGHAWGLPEITQPNTCTTAGRYTYRCTICNTSKFEVLPASGHTWQAATCTKPKTCSNCGATEGSALGHTKVSYPTVQPTYTTVGYRGGSYCSVCGTVLSERTTILATPLITDITWSDQGCTVDVWIKNNNSLPVTCYASLYDDDDTGMEDGAFSIGANTSEYVSLSYNSSAVMPLWVDVWFEAANDTQSYIECVEVR